MNAKEMFEKLGYKETYNGYDFIEYSRSYNEIISINKKDKSYCHEDGDYITFELHKAITQQMKELGWLE